MYSKGKKDNFKLSSFPYSIKTKVISVIKVMTEPKKFESNYRFVFGFSIEELAL